MTFPSFQFPELPEILKPYRERIIAFLSRPMVLASGTDTLATKPWQSRMGGNPYLPKGVPNPVLDQYEGNSYHRFMMLLQINFEEMPQLPGFPEKGILQFFVTGEPDITDSPGYNKLIYYPETIMDTNDLVTDFSGLPAKEYNPFFGFEYAPNEGVLITFEYRDFSLTNSHHEFNRDVETLFNDIPDDDKWKELQDALADYLGGDLYEAYQEWRQKNLPETQIKSNIQIGGNVFQFFNDDRRETDDGGVIYDTLLMEYEGPGAGTKYALPLQGYGAVPQFFLRKKDLASKNFSDYFYECMS